MNVLDRTYDQSAPAPANIEAEQALLGAIFVNNEAFREVEAIITAHDFSEEIHKLIFKACSDLIAAGRVATPITVKSAVADFDLGPTLTPAQYLARLTSEATTVINARDYARTIRDYSICRDALETIADARDCLLNIRYDSNIGEIVSDAAGELQKIIEGETGGAVIETGAEGTESFFELAEARARGDSDATLVETGFKSLDRLTVGGFKAGDLWVIGARSAVGKTALACCMSKATAEAGNAAFLISCEVQTAQIKARLLSSMTFFAGKIIPYGEIESGRFNPSDQSLIFKLRNAQQRLAALPISYVSANTPTIAQIRLMIRAEKRRLRRQRLGLKVVFIDFLELIAPPTGVRDTHDQLNKIVYALKGLAKEEGLCIVLLAQINRDVDKRDNKRPTKADLKGSAAIEAAGDVVLLMHREAALIEQDTKFQNSDPEALAKYDAVKHTAELILAKNRRGATVLLKTACVVECSALFEDKRFYVNGNNVPCFGGDVETYEML